jgi:hypothetical protein
MRRPKEEIPMNLNPLKGWYKPSGYTKWYWYPIVMPIVAIFLLYVLIDNAIYDLVRKK